MKQNFMSRVALAARAIRGDVAAIERIEPTMASKSSGGGALQPLELPVAKKGQTSIPSFRTQIERSDDLLKKTNRVTANTDATDFRVSTDKPTMIRNFLAANPDMAATVNAYLRVGIPREFTITGRDIDGRVNPAATALANQLIVRLTYIGDPTLGYNPSTDLQSMSETLSRELLLDGGMMLELVLDDMLQPTYPAPIAISKISFREDKDKGVYPVQVLAGEEVDLDLPTIFYVAADQDLLTAYAASYLDTAIRAVLTDEGFSNYLQRQLKRNISPRMIATVIEEKLKKSVGPEILNDGDKMHSYLEGFLSAIEDQLNSLEPEDALITTDMVEYELKAPGGSGSGIGDLLQKVNAILESRTTAALKSLPAVLGRDTSSGSATTSTYLFMKSAELLSTKLNTLYSRMLTQAVRLMGMDCYVEFKYAELDLRPKGEQEAYKAMEQSRLMEQWSLGLITDAEASIRLTGKVPPQGFKPLSGTGFYKGGGGGLQDTTSQTSLMNGQKDNLKSNAPLKKGN